MIEVVSATRLSKAQFWSKSALGLSLQRLKSDTRLSWRIAFENRRGLPEIFNSRIEAVNDADILIFVHDDVWIDDYNLADHVQNGLKQCDVLGLAGVTKRFDNQPAWAFDESLAWIDKSLLSGRIAHGAYPCGAVSDFGGAPQTCLLLDGVFLACRKKSLVDKGVRFDPIFDFHFYDLDFCRSVDANGLRMLTWPIAVTHQSAGAGFGGENWHRKRVAYFEKWGS